jgi:hypothetical protein
MASGRLLSVLVLALVLAGPGLGCDQGGADLEDRGPAPLVSGLVVRPDSVNAADVPPDRVEDSLARVDVFIQAAARDPGGTVERVEFTIEPSTNPRGTASGTLRRETDSLYARRLGLRLPVFVTEVYTVRVFAVDDDSLASNQVLGQFRFVAAP